MSFYTEAADEFALPPYPQVSALTLVAKADVTDVNTAPQVLREQAVNADEDR